MTEVFDQSSKRIEKYLDRVLEGFVDDPADSEFQLGYLAALKEIYFELTGRTREEHRS